MNPCAGALSNPLRVLSSANSSFVNGQPGPAAGVFSAAGGPQPAADRPGTCWVAMSNKVPQAVGTVHEPTLGAPLKRRPADHAGDAGSCTTVFRRFTGPAADELAILCRPQDRSRDTAQQAAAAYRALASLLAAQKASFRDLASETLFLHDIRRELPLVLDVRTRVLAEIDHSAAAPPPAFIQQAPVDQGVSFELCAGAVIPRHRDTWSVRDVRAMAACACEGCAGSAARLVRLGDQVSVYTTNIHGVGGDAFQQAFDMFRVAERLLEQCGIGFHNVVRTWIALRDIGRDYDALNEARRCFFQRRGIEPRPASTGVQGIPLPDAHDFSMRLYAVQAPRPLAVSVMCTPMLSEAWSYGADFSRGLRITDANKVALHVSGTASIDDAGRTVHAGNFEAQADRMLGNIASLLAEQGATFENVVAGVTYLRNPGDATRLRSAFRKRGFEGFPCALVEAPLCRPELLCETEAVALLPLATAGQELPE
jgi:enamine deaminase RidA (YjgF/YER057c/UK114 family)